MRPWGTLGICIFFCSVVLAQFPTTDLAEGNRKTSQVKILLWRDQGSQNCGRMSSGYLPSLNCACSTFCWDNDQDLTKVPGVLYPPPPPPAYLQGIAKSQFSWELPCRGQGLSLGSCSFYACFFLTEGRGEEVVFYLPPYR